jgi:hypothetical protein
VGVSVPHISQAIQELPVSLVIHSGCSPHEIYYLRVNAAAIKRELDASSSLTLAPQSFGAIQLKEFLAHRPLKEL